MVAQGLSCAYVIADAYRHPRQYERLVLVSPPVEMLEETLPGPFGAVRKVALRAPLTGPFVYNILTSRGAIRGYYDRQGYHNLGLITDDLVEYIYTSAHQPNANLPAASLFGGSLISDVSEPLARLQMPVITVWGREGVLAPAGAGAAFKRVNPRIETRIIDRASQHLQEEQPERFNTLIREFAGAAIS